jgi:hypothetical protein
MTLEDLHAIIEEKVNTCETQLEHCYDGEEAKKIEGCMEALQLVMKLIEEAHGESEL